MITVEQYFQAKPHSPAQARAAANLLVAVNALLDEAERDGAFSRNVDPDTGSEISGSKGGSGDGGFRLDTALTGGGHSSHKVLWSQNPDGTWRKELVDPKAGVDVYDASDRLDDWLDRFEDGKGGNSKLAEYGLYREAPGSTPRWCHLTDRAPRSGRRTFQP